VQIPQGCSVGDVLAEGLADVFGDKPSGPLSPGDAHITRRLLDDFTKMLQLLIVQGRPLPLPLGNQALGTIGVETVYPAFNCAPVPSKFLGNLGGRKATGYKIQPKQAFPHSGMGGL